MPRSLAAGAWIYRAALMFYPPGFRSEFGAEMARDFDEASRDAWHDQRWKGLGGLWIHTSADFAKTMLMQWLRSGLPAIALASAAFAVLSVGATAQLLPRADLPTPATQLERDQLVLLLLVVVVLTIVAAVLVFNLWFSRALQRRRPYRPRA
jgi:hypothetical protein